MSPDLVLQRRRVESELPMPLTLSSVVMGIGWVSAIANAASLRGKTCPPADVTVIRCPDLTPIRTGRQLSSSIRNRHPGELDFPLEAHRLLIDVNRHECHITLRRPNTSSVAVAVQFKPELAHSIVVIHHHPAPTKTEQPSPSFLREFCSSLRACQTAYKHLMRNLMQIHNKMGLDSFKTQFPINRTMQYLKRLRTQWQEIARLQLSHRLSHGPV